MKTIIARYLHRLASLFEKGNNQKVIAVREGFKDVSTRDTFEGAWYLMQGGVFDRVRERELPARRADKLGYKREWTIYFKKVPLHAIDVLREGRATVSIERIATERRRLKRYIKNYLHKSNGTKKGK